MSSNMDCQSCGACCAGVRLSTIEVTDYDRTPREYTGLVPGTWTNDITGQQQDGFRLMRRVDDRCIALRGEVGQQVSCAIYDRRPAICQRFDPGERKMSGCTQALLHSEAAKHKGE